MRRSFIRIYRALITLLDPRNKSIHTLDIGMLIGLILFLYPTLFARILPESVIFTICFIGVILNLTCAFTLIDKDALDF